MDTHTHDPQLPWGHWLRLEDRHATAVVVDGQDREWKSVRDAFWSGRLRFSSDVANAQAEQLELLNTVLSAMVRRPAGEYERTVDLFNGDHRFHRWFLCWMEAEGLLAPSAAKPSSHDRVTAEGRSALLMLDATRPFNVSSMRPSRATLDRLVDAAGQSPQEEERRHQAEAVARRMICGFIRREDTTITLFMRGDDDPVTGRMPIGRTVWSIAFDEKPNRDDFYDWLCKRIDRWPAWADLSFRRGAGALTRHLLMTLSAALKDRDEARADGGGKLLAITHGDQPGA